MLKSHRDVYETFDQQFPQDLISAATETRISAEALVHCVKVMKNLEKNERSDNKTKRYAKAQVERFGSEPGGDPRIDPRIHFHAIAQVVVFFHEESRQMFSVAIFFFGLGLYPNHHQSSQLLWLTSGEKYRARRGPMMLQG